MPTFLIIGAPKAGTSSVYQYLKQHPAVYMSPVKEPHFFTFEGQEINFQGPGDLLRFQRAVTCLDDYKRLFAGVTTETAIGEASTTYLRSAAACQRIYKYLPNAKLIIILRNPVETAYASFLHLWRDGDETIKDFEQALREEPNRINQNWEDLWHYRQRGFYYQQVKQYVDRFPSDQLRIYLYEDLLKDPLMLIQGLFSFIGVDPTFVPDISRKYNVSAMPRSTALNRLIVSSNPIKNMSQILLPNDYRHSLSKKLKAWNFNHRFSKTIPQVTRNDLIQSYYDDVCKLQDLIQRDLRHWLR